MTGDKIKSIDELSAIAARARSEGHKVVLAHGVFDILHVGHKRHLEIGKRNGELLLVTITTDRHVNKGPGRPVFPERLRAEMLAGLEIVDHVGISPNPGAEYVIEKIRPDVYLKGSEYQAEESDVTGRITTERTAVEKYGGQVLFTEDITFSSSNLANIALQLYPDEAADFLKALRGRVTLPDLTKQLDALAGMRCLIVGDTILDEYVYVEPLGKPSKENIISTRYLDKEVFCGGVGATANLVAQFCGTVDLVTVLGGAESQEDFIRSALHPNINLVPFYRDGARTTVKSRLVDPGYVKKLIEVAYLVDSPLPAPMQAAINRKVEEMVEHYDAVIVNDFGHGLIDDELIDIFCRKARFLAVNAQTNSANRGFNLVTKYPRADFVCIDEPEARLAVADRYSAIETVIRDKLQRRMNCPTFIVTHGKLGAVVVSRDHGIQRIPALIDQAIDTIGAGDAFFSVSAPLVAGGCDPFLAGFIGNAVGAMKIRIVGHRHHITRPEVIKYIATLLK
ncbi:MAG TPA: PfkB family carbohydrate kinase [Xanthobacteraceae bacterium]|nr:PfkB family carbohydrate kinase [Xanthobacteraceae bacterium]